MSRPDDSEWRRLHAELSAEREALLAVIADVDARALALPTRNPGWALGDVLAHVLACDADLVWLLECAAGSETQHPPQRGHEQHREEMARWGESSAAMLGAELRERAGRWRQLLEELPNPAVSMPARIWWREEPAPLGDIIADWRGHDAQHAEDVRLALEARAGRAP